ncbi:hypothetical protein [Actimicrobium antarcticum]|uniref:hypothetical protein n=1 Tax=Actimicrobium antarcticum TaxID=1051899 RepID=UPI0031D7C3FF
MSIAVSAVVVPSRIFKLLCGVMSIMTAGIALSFFHAVNPDEVLLIKFCLSAVALIGAVAIFLPIFAKENVSIDISGVGQIRVRQCGVRTASVQEDAPAGPDDAVMTLLPGTAIFSCLLLLRFTNDTRGVKTLLIFPDSVSAECFRRLSVACRWIAAENLRLIDKI